MGPLLSWLALASVPALAISCSSSSTDKLAADGTVEVVETDIAPMQAARIVSVRADEGAAVRAGDTLALLTQATTQADVAERAARVSAAEAALRDLRAGARATDIRAAEAELAAARAEAGKAAADLARIRPLADSAVTSRQALDAAVAASRIASARRPPPPKRCAGCAKAPARRRSGRRKLTWPRRGQHSVAARRWPPSSCSRPRATASCSAGWRSRARCFSRVSRSSPSATSAIPGRGCSSRRRSRGGFVPEAVFAARWMARPIAR